MSNYCRLMEVGQAKQTIIFQITSPISNAAIKLRQND